jgi:hypothetical protein
MALALIPNCANITAAYDDSNGLSCLQLGPSWFLTQRLSPHLRRLSPHHNPGADQEASGKSGREQEPAVGIISGGGKQSVRPLAGSPSLIS